MHRIKKLEQQQIEQIAAGEVIVRPSAVIKELVENSIDAGATQIIVEVEHAGLDWIRISDNGSGIQEIDFSLVFERHATSKLDEENSLSSIHTLGFRGEALASIHAVADIEVITKTKNSSYAYRILTFAGEETQVIEKCGSTVGTIITVTNLFKTMPVRKKYIQSEKREISENAKFMRKLALSHPEISFIYKHQNKLIFKTPGNNNILKTIYEIYGYDYTNQLLKVQYSNTEIEIQGYVSNIHSLRGSRAYQFLFLNNRMINNSEIVQSIESPYRELTMEKTFPLIFLYMNIPNEYIDINIHPQKSEAFISQHLGLEKILREMVTDVLFRTRTENKISESLSKSSPNMIYLSSEKNIWNLDNLPMENKGEFLKELELEEDEILEIQYSDNQSSLLQFVQTKEPDYSNYLEEQTEIATFEKKTTLLDHRIIGIFMHRYILLEDTKKETLLLLDQHAAHEKVLYEEIQNKKESKIFEMQYLIRGEVFPLEPERKEEFVNFREQIKLFGFDIELFDEHTVVLRAIPNVLNSSQIQSQFQILWDSFLMGENVSLLREKFAKLACTAAVKSGDSLSAEEIYSLLKRLSLCQQPNICPHGRPTIVELSKTEIDKLFKRV